jgi:hypothetical protein
MTIRTCGGSDDLEVHLIEAKMRLPWMILAAC